MEPGTGRGSDDRQMCGRLGQSGARVPSMLRSPCLAPGEPIGTRSLRVSSPAVRNGPQSLLAQRTWNRTQTHVPANRAVSLVHKREVMPPILPQARTWVRPCSPCTYVYEWACHNPMYTHGLVSTLTLPSRPRPHKAGARLPAGMHTHTRGLSRTFSRAGVGTRPHPPVREA